MSHLLNLADELLIEVGAIVVVAALALVGWALRDRIQQWAGIR